MARGSAWSHISIRPDPDQAGFTHTRSAMEFELEADAHAGHFDVHPGEVKSAVGRNAGARRAFEACSQAYASLISFPSFHAVPMKLIPTGRPKTCPTGTVMLG